MKYTKFIYFLIGIGVGGAAAYFPLRNKLKAKYEAQMQSVVDAFAEREVKEEMNQTPSENKADAPHNLIISDNGSADEVYHNIMGHYVPSESNQIHEHVTAFQFPYVISPDDLKDETNQGNWNFVRLYSFADGIVTDKMLHVLSDVDEVIGDDSLNHFGEYADDAVYVRNEKLETDFEIISDPRTYQEAVEGE